MGMGIAIWEGMGIKNPFLNAVRTRGAEIK